MLYTTRGVSAPSHTHSPQRPTDVTHTVWSPEQAVTSEHCEAHDIMVVSGSVGGGNIKDRLNACTTPQIIYEVSPLNPIPQREPQHEP